MRGPRAGACAERLSLTFLMIVCSFSLFTQLRSSVLIRVCNGMCSRFSMTAMKVILWAS